MLSRKNTALTLIVGVAMAGALVATAMPANAQGDTKSHGSATSSTPTQNSVAPKVKHSIAPSGSKLAQIDADACYAYSDGSGDLCLWYYYNYAGSRGGFFSNDSNLNNDYFVTSGTGQGSHMNNNAESAWNYDHVWTAWTATSPNYTGSVGYVKPWTGGNFTSTFTNNVESVYWTL